MHLTIFEEPPELIQQQRAALFRDLQAVTVFGVGAIQQRRGIDHEILNEQRWQLSSQTRGLLQKAAQQLGTSGSGNHFAELIIGERLAAVASETIALPQRFCGLLTHSGSRGIGYAIANQYMRVAAQETSRHAKVPRMYEWLELDGDAGKEYWLAMQLAGDYAQANHEIIHAGFARRAKLTPLVTVQNHHNFAWLSGDMVIHRKGATPAEKGVLGIIPGSMASASYLVEGCGVEEALCSAAHGAGRLGSRNAARSRTTLREVQRLLAERDVLIQGLSVDESPLAYKDIERVMALHYAADPDIWSPLDVAQDIDVFFYGHGAEYREDWIRAMIAGPSRALPGRRFAVRGTALGDLGRAERLPYLSFSKLREYACRSRINLLITRQAHASVYASSNARPFELAALGACMVSSPYSGLETWFEPEKEVIILASPEEATERIAWLLDHESERAAIGAAARARFLQEHTYRHRAGALVAIIRQYL